MTANMYAKRRRFVFTFFMFPYRVNGVCASSISGEIPRLVVYCQPSFKYLLNYSCSVHSILLVLISVIFRFRVFTGRNLQRVACWKPVTGIEHYVNNIHALVHVRRIPTTVNVVPAESSRLCTTRPRIYKSCARISTSCSNFICHKLPSHFLALTVKLELETDSSPAKAIFSHNFLW